MSCRAKPNRILSTRSCASMLSTPMKSPRTPAWVGASIPSCRPASSPSAVSCRAKQAIAEIKHAIEKTYGKRGEAVVKANFLAVDQTLANLHEVNSPRKGDQQDDPPSARPRTGAEVRARSFWARSSPSTAITCPSAPSRSTARYPTGTTQWEKRNITLEIPVLEPNLCIQCGKCTFVCPHAVIRAKVYDPAYLKDAPASWISMDAKWKEFPGMKYSLVGGSRRLHRLRSVRGSLPGQGQDPGWAQGDQYGDQPPIREREKINWEFFLSLPETDRTKVSPRMVKNSQFMQPLFEFSGACTGCGETPYVKLVTQLFGDRIIVANATGCSSIYGGNLPTTPWSQNKDGRGPAWSNSLFEDNAEFGLGLRLTLDKQGEYVRELLPQLADKLGEDLVNELINADQSNDLGIRQQRERVALAQAAPARDQ